MMITLINQFNENRLKIIGILLFIFVIIFSISSGCTDAVVTGGEDAVKAGEESGGLGLASHAIPVVSMASNEIAQSGIAASPPPISIVDETKTIPYNHILSYLLAGDQGYQFDININTDGNPVDVLVMDENDYQIYSKAFTHGGTSSFDAVTYRYVTSQNFQNVLPSQGKYYLVIENAPFLQNGADAQRDVNVQVSVDLIR